VAVLRDPTIAAGIGQTGAIQSVAPSLGVQVSPVGVRDASEIEARHRGIRSWGKLAGLIVLGAPLAHHAARLDQHARGQASITGGLPGPPVLLRPEV